MADKMLIDASHSEETRVVVVRGNRIEEFDFESQYKKQLRGNIYLAKVTRVEPSLQAAFVDYGGNRHGFLAFSEIHPDYYQIPLADRQALVEADAEEAQSQNLADENAPDGESETNLEEKPKAKKRRSRRRKPKDKQEEVTGTGTDNEADQLESEDLVAQNAVEASENPTQETETSDGEEQNASLDATTPSLVESTDATSPDESEEAAESSSEDDGSDDGENKPDIIAAIIETEDEVSEPVDNDKAISDLGPSDILEDAPQEAEKVEAEAESAEDVKAEDASDKDETNAKKTAKSPRQDEDEADLTSDSDDEENVEEVGVEDALEELPETPRRTRKQYRIQEVIKRRQIILVQIVKEERGNKGAALTTYLSLAGRYSVLMPNTARGGGISRKITNVQDRKRLKEVAQELEVPTGMGVILRTAGASRTKTEIRRDFEYLMRLWESVRDLTLKSMAPCLVYEEGSLIKRSVRDLYNKDINEVIVSGDEGYREAKDFMKMLMPSHAKAVQPYRGARPIFTNFGIEAQLDQMLSPQVTLKSGGYLIINQTEALVAVDVNSGRSTRESSIEDTALQTNLEAAEEVARQLRLRDLAGLVVIDFIDMEEKRNNRAVEKRVKECLKNDRARIQVGRISHFGLLEMSRQRIRASVLESTTQSCPHCEGTGHIRSDSSFALHILRAIEEQLLRAPRNDVNVKTSASTALYVLNNKRDTISELEQRFGVTITINVDPTIVSQEFVTEKGAVSNKTASIDISQLAVSSYGDADAEMLEAKPQQETESQSESDEGGPRKKRRRRRRRGRGNSDENQNEVANQNDEADMSPQTEAKDADANSDIEATDDGEERPKKRRRRGKRGGRKNRERDAETGSAVETTADTSVDEVKVDTSAREDEQNNEQSTADEEKPKKPRARRSKKFQEEDQATSNDLGAGTSVSASDEPKRVKPSRESRTNLDAIASEPVVTSSSSDPSDTDAPKRTGWWRRAFK